MASPRSHALAAGVLVVAAAAAIPVASHAVTSSSASSPTVLAAAPQAVHPRATPTAAPTPTPTPTPTPKPPPPVGRTTFPLRAHDVGTLVATVQQRLVWLGYPVRVTRVMDTRTVAAIRRFRIKFFLGSTPTVTAPVWKKLSRLTATKGVLPAGCRTGTVLCIDKSQKTLRYIKNGVILLTADARFGGEGHPTREGSFRVYSKSRDHTSTLYHTWMPFAMFFSGGQAVHYSPYFHRDGYYGASHGCVNLHDKSTARWLFDRVRIGTRVVVYH